MIRSDEFLAALGDAGFGLISGVPCSYLTPLINATIDSQTARYDNAGNEGEAVAIATGAALGGLPGVAMFQNSGLGNAVSPLTSLNWVFRVPILLITTWRGQPGGPADEPQHELMGRITFQQLELMDIPAERFPRAAEEIPAVLDRAARSMNESRRPYALVMEKGAFQAHPLQPATAELRVTGRVDGTNSDRSHMLPDDALRALQTSVAPADVVLATTGFTGRALYALGDRDNQLYMVGSMGCVSTLGLGLAVAQPGRRVVVIDGDGALLMRTGALAAVASERPDNLLHVVLDNGVHDSTGSQATLSSTVDIPALAVGSGYPEVQRVDSPEALANAVADPRPGLRLLYVRTLPRSDRKLPRPDCKPAEVARRLRRFLGIEDN